MTRPWAWSFVAAAVLFAATAAVSQGQGAAGLASATLTFAAFTVLVGLGQMAVVTMGPGNVDLSIPAVMVLAGTLSLKLMGGVVGSGLWGVLAALAVGLGAGLGNYALIRLLRIPPIIATLSASFLYESLAIWSNRGLRIKPPATLGDIAIGATAGVPNVAWIALLAAAGFAVALEQGAYGRRLSAIGQNARAARLAGVPVEGTRLATYVLSATMAALAGFLLSCFSGGASLNMGDEFLLGSIAAVVIGGSSIAGGDSNVPGIWGASMVLFLIVSMLNSYGLGAGVRLVLTGVIIIAVVVAASRRRSV